MIEISHRQAERLISRQFDIPLSDEDWNALQNHLERCPDCRTFQYRFQCTERKISQSLRARWDPVTGPTRHLPQIVSKIKDEKDAGRTNQTTALFYLGVFSLILLVAAVRVQSRGLEKAVPIPQTGETKNFPTPTAYPTPPRKTIPLVHPGQFPHMVAYESKIEGNSEIYLLNPGFSPVNLTQNPAEDIYPTWSPDGEWLAFLSNRTAPDRKYSKNELYVISIAGNQLVQLTSENMVDWEGPLTWSADGKWIAVAGVLRDVSRQRSIFLVDVDGSNLRPLPNTQGGTSPKFAPYGDRLAFRQRDRSLNRIVIYHIDSGQATIENISPSNKYSSPADVAFDWPADGDGLYYTAALMSTRSVQTPKCSRIFIIKMPNNEAWHKKLRDHFHLAGREIAPLVHSLSWAPEEMVIYTVESQVQDSGITPCDNQGNCAGYYNFTPSRLSKPDYGFLFPDLCVQSGIDRSSWSLDMGWLILTAYEQGVKDAGLYAIRMKGFTLDWQLPGTDGIQSPAITPGTILRLSPGSVQSSLLRIRPFRTGMNIKPQPGQMETIRTAAITKRH